MIKLVLANKEEYIQHIEAVLEKTLGNATLMTQPNIVWLLLVEDQKPIGCAYAYAISDVRMYVNILFVGVNAHHAGRKKVGKDLIKWLKETSDQVKYETTIPKESTAKLRYFTQLGFKREGIARQSIIVNGKLQDQHYMGYQV